VSVTIFKRKKGIRRRFLPGFKNSLLFGILTDFVLTVAGSPSLAIRFQSEDEGGFRRTVYPEAIKNVVHRADELKSLAGQSHLAALFPYLELTDLVKRQPVKAGATASSPLINFLNQSADLIVAQSPEDIQMPLRRMYFSGESVRVTDSVWREADGGRHVRGLLLSGNAISVEIVSGLEDTPGLQKLHRLIAMIEIGQAYAAREANRGADYRLYFPVLDMLNKIVGALFVDEVLKKMGTDSIRQELVRVDAVETVKASLEYDFLGRGYLYSKSISWALQNPELRGPQLAEWVRELRLMRDQKARSINGLSSYSEKVEAIIRQDLLSQPSDKYFQLARAARSAGDEKTFRIVSDLMVGRSTGAEPSGQGPSCERSFRIQ
jgi:hypothetical protein